PRPHRRGTEAVLPEVSRRWIGRQDHRPGREPVERGRVEVVLVRVRDQNDPGLVVDIGWRRGNEPPADRGVPVRENRVGDDPESFDVDVRAGVAPECDRVRSRFRVDDGGNPAPRVVRERRTTHPYRGEESRCREEAWGHPDWNPAGIALLRKTT